MQRLRNIINHVQQANPFIVIHFLFDFNETIINHALSQLCRLYCVHMYVMATCQTPIRPTQRRHDRRKILGENNVAASSIPVDDSFLSSHNFSLASAGSYTDFQVKTYTLAPHFIALSFVSIQHGIMLASEAQKHCRSSAIPKNSSMENNDY